jgi:predicted HicB family RNase H-like nuclease
LVFKEVAKLENEKPKSLTVRVDEDFHKEVRMRCFEMGVSIQDFLMEAIQKHLKRNERRAQT